MIEQFPLALDELTNITDTIQFLIQGVKLFEEFEVTKEVVSMNSLHEQLTTGDNIFKEAEKH